MNDTAQVPSIDGEPSSQKVASSELPPIFMTAGNKGGVGKSMTALVLIDQLREAGRRSVYIETDTNNPDVYRCLQRKSAPDEALEGVALETAKLGTRTGWLELVDLIDAHPDRTVVINSAANLGDAIKLYGSTLQQSLAVLRRRLVTFWLLNRQRDSMDQLREYIEVFPGSTVHVVRNGLFGSENQFELYNSSRLRGQIEANGGKSLTLPDLADRVADALYTQRLAISDGLEKMTVGNRVELIRWRKETHRVFEEVLS